ncbi:Cell morphogenesis protein PAG1, partial [Coemansia sp. RSA 25]
TQLLRAVDERFSEILVGGIFSRDARSSMSFVQPGDPLVDGPGAWPYSQQLHSHQYCSRRFMHAANLSSASTASNHNNVGNDVVGRGLGGTVSDSEESYVRHAYSTSVGQANDPCDSDTDAGSSAAAATAAMAAALDVKARMERSAWSSSASGPSSSLLSVDAAARELNGGYLHAFLDLMHYLEVSLCEYQAEEDAATNAASSAASGGALADQAGTAMASAAGSSSSLPEGEAGNGSTADEGAVGGGGGAAADIRAVGGRSLVDWVKLVNAIEANAVALLCSSSARVRHLAVDILYQAGVLRRILGASEPLPSAGQAWAFRGVDSAYEILNVMVPLRAPAGKIAALGGGGALIGELWDVPFDGVEASGTQQQQQSQPLARLAASSAAADVALWMAYLPQFVGRASVLMPEVMLVSRTLVCQRLYQMQPLMSQYAEVSVRAGGLQHGTLYVRASGVGRTHAAGSSSSSSSSSVALRADLISAFNSLFLFAVVSLPACGGLNGGGLGGGGGGGSGALLGETVVGSRSPRNGGIGGSNSGAFSNSRLAKSIARKLAPLKASSRGSKQEHGVGLASISQLVRMAGVLLRSDNAPLRQSAALALCHTPAAYLAELMQELRPLAESLFDDGSSLGSHRHYLHVSGASSSTAGGGGSGGRDGLLGALGHHGPSSSPGSSAMSASGSSPKPQAAQQVYRTGSTLLAAAQLAPHGSSKRRSNRAAVAAAAAASQAASAALGSDTEATSDSGNNNNNSGGNGVQGRRASSFDATTMARGSSAAGAGLRRPLEASATFSNGSSGGGATSSANAAANAAAIAAVSGGSGSASQMRRKRLRLSLAQIYRQVSRQLSADSDEQVLGQLIAYVRETKTFLSETSVQWEAEHQALRTHFCGLVEALYYCISSAALADSVKLKFTCETRNGLYQLFERWCGLGRHASAGHETRARMAAAVLDQVKDPAERALAAEALEGEFRLLELASLRGMAVLCRDAAHFHLALPPPPPPLALALAPAAAAESSGPRDKAALFAWVSDALDHHDARVQRIGQHAVEWAVGADARDAAMVRVVVQMSYGLSVASSVSNGFVEDAGLVDRAAGAASAAASGLGLMFSSSSHKQQPPQSSEALATDRVALGHLRALTSIMGAVAPPHAPVAAAAPLLPGVLLPLVLFRLRSERHRMRRQALVLLRVLCAHASKRECQARLDELAPSIVSDIPAVAADAAARLAAAVAAAFASHSQAAILECVRQVHAQAALGGRLEALLAILRPWVANVRLRRVVETVAYTASASARPCHVENDVYADCDGLDPVALSRDSLVVLRCMLYLTVKAGLEAMPGIEGLWLALVGGSYGEPNTWLVMRYLTGLLLHTQSLALLGFMRRIAVFLTRQSAAEAEAQGRQLVRRLVDEARRPGAATPIEAASTVAHNTANEALPGEAWTTEFVFAPRRATRVLVSTAGLAMFYLAAVSYEQPAVVVDYGDLAVLAPAVFALANPERWVRDAARTVLVNLVTAERAWCGSTGLSDTAAADAAHAVLSVLRGDECANGFGNVRDKDEDSEEHKRKPGRSPDDDYALGHAWSPMAAANVPADLASGEGEDEAPKDCGGDPPAIDVTDPSVVADVADASLPLPPPPPPSFPQRRSMSIDYHLDAGGGAGGNSNSSGGGGGGPGRERATLQRFAVQLSRLFCRRRPGCAQEWAGVAVRWAMSCPVRPLAALALQVFSVLAAEAQYGGALVITPTRSMILHLIDRLSNVVGDPSDDLAAFAETVLAALRQTAALAARMCAEDEDIRADLLAASVVLMATAQSAPVYAMAVAVFERIIPLVEAHEQYFRRLVADRIGGAGVAQRIGVCVVS